jgi:V8-like Glu-specific endopeptidase
MWQAQELVKISNKLFDPTLFDEDLISPEFSRAIVRIYNIKDHENIAQGSGFIVATDQNIFLVTAAHCLLDQAQYYIEVDKVKIKLEPIIVDKNNDVAVLNISLDAINNYYEYTGRTIPYIPFDQLSHVKPEKYEVVALQGHPSYVPPSERGFYRKKFVTLGPETFSIKDTQSANVPGQLLFTFNPETITGASGSPVISIKDKRAQIVGLVSGAFPGTIEILGKSLNRPFGVATSAGVGQLPEYLRQAENIQKEKTQPESWSNYFKRTMWR